MTGFGQAAAEAQGIHYTVELRTVNNRYFKATVRLPEELAHLEAELEARLRKMIFRGSITLVVRFRKSEQLPASHFNETVLLDYFQHLQKIHVEVMPDQPFHLDWAALLALPGVLQPDPHEQAIWGAARKTLQSLVDQACEGLTRMRQAEGKAIEQDLARHRQEIATQLQVIREKAPVVVEEYHQRLQTRIHELLAKAKLEVAQPDLLREVAVYAERCDISEEVDRLTGHLQQFEQIVRDADGEPAGRTLDFLTQEMLREANTIASKSNDAQISQAIVWVKGAIDRIKEQVQNVE